MRRVAMVCFLSVLCLLCSACPSTAYGKAGALGLDVVNTIHVGADTADQLRLAGTINSNDEKQVLKYLDSLNTVATQAYKPCIQSAHAANGTAEAYASCAHALALAVDNPALLHAVHIENENAIKHVQAVSTAVDNVIQIAIMGFGQLTAKGK